MSLLTKTLQAAGATEEQDLVHGSFRTHTLRGLRTPTVLTSNAARRNRREPYVRAAAAVTSGPAVLQGNKCLDTRESYTLLY
jgi:hypothetical protein